jgi:hypothetical protein
VHSSGTVVHIYNKIFPPLPKLVLTQALLWSYDLALQAPPPHTPFCILLVGHTDGKGGGGAKSHEHKKAWSSIYNSILSGTTLAATDSPTYVVTVQTKKCLKRLSAVKALLHGSSLAIITKRHYLDFLLYFFDGEKLRLV